MKRWERIRPRIGAEPRRKRERQRGEARKKKAAPRRDIDPEKGVKRQEDVKDVIRGSRWQEWLAGGCLTWAAAWLCFRSLALCVVSTAFVPLYLRVRRSEREKQTQRALWGEFRDVMAILYSSTAAGATLEKALRVVRQDMRDSEKRYPMLLPEFERLCARMDRNISAEEALNDFSVRSKDEDIAYFVQVLSVARKSGAPLAEIIRHTADTMNMRMEVNSEIETILAGKKGELRVMMIVPPAILLYMNLCSAEYMSVLYETAAGRLTMAAALVIYGAAVWIGRRILAIRI